MWCGRRWRLLLRGGRRRCLGRLGGKGLALDWLVGWGLWWERGRTVIGIDQVFVVVVVEVDGRDVLVVAAGWGHA